MSKPPNFIKINLDDYHAKLVGKLNDGRQFFITQPFVMYANDYVARYLFGKDGKFIEAKIHDLGKRNNNVLPGNGLVGSELVESIPKAFLTEMGSYVLSDIKVAPFRYSFHGVDFGLIANKEDDDDDWTVTAEPGDYMAFFPPWDGDYDT